MIFFFSLKLLLILTTSILLFITLVYFFGYSIVEKGAITIIKETTSCNSNSNLRIWWKKMPFKLINKYLLI